LREDVEVFVVEQKAHGYSDAKSSRHKTMAITVASKREPTSRSMMWPGCRNATIGPD
jgi:hypothetical protein